MTSLPLLLLLELDSLLVAPEGAAQRPRRTDLFPSGDACMYAYEKEARVGRRSSLMARGR